MSREWLEGGDEEKSNTESKAFLFLPSAQSETFLPTEVDQHISLFDPALPLPSVEAKELIGRAALLVDLKQRLCKERWLTVYGLPGIGKTALALALAYDAEIRAYFQDGVLWGGLGVQPQVAGILGRWGGLVGVTPAVMESAKTNEAWSNMLRVAIGEKRLLIVLDDAWQLEAVQALKIGGPHCAYLITTRIPQLASQLAGENAIQVAELEDQDGLHLLARFAPQILEHEYTAAQELVRAVGGLPLALTLMGRYLGAQAYAANSRRLQSALARLRDAEQRVQLSLPQPAFATSGKKTVNTSVSIESVLAVSDLQLPPEGRQALRDLSMLPTKPDSFTEEVALAVSNVPVALLHQLSDAGLLERPGSNRYTLHTVVADYAHSGQSEEAGRRLIDYGIRYLETYKSDPTAWQEESAMIIAALEQARKLHCFKEFVHGVCLFSPFLYMRGWYQLAEQLLQQAALDVRKLGDQKALSEVLEHQATVAFFCGEYEQSQEWALQGLQLAQHFGDKRLTSHLITGLAMLSTERGDYEKAEDLYREGLIVASEIEDQQQLALQLKGLGVLAKRHGNLTEAEDFCQRALEQARAIHNEDLTSLLLMNLGGIAHEQGDYARAEEFYCESLKLARDLGYSERICVLLANQGVIADARGDYALAEKYFCEGLALARQLRHPERISLLLMNLGVVLGRRGNDEQAEECYLEALGIARQLGLLERISLLLLNLGEVHFQRHEYAQAEHNYLEGLKIARQLGLRGRISDLLLHLGVMEVTQGHVQQAEPYITEGLEIAQQMQIPQLISRLLCAQGDLQLLQGQIDLAWHSFSTTLLIRPKENQFLFASALYGQARVAQARQRTQEARQLGERSYQLFETLGHRKREVLRDFLNSLPAENGDKVDP